MGKPKCTHAHVTRIETHPIVCHFQFQTRITILPQDATTALAPHVNLNKQRPTTVDGESCVGAKTVDPKAAFQLRAARDDVPMSTE